MVENRGVRVAFETARMRLAEIRAEGLQARQLAYEATCERSAKTLNVERVSIWFLRSDGEVLERALQYTLSSGCFERGGQIQRRGCEQYFDALLSRRVVAADNAFEDERTAELGEYLKRQQIYALLDAPIYRDGQVVGVVCHEHVGTPRRWSESEAGFSSAVADLLTILIHQAERAELRAALEAQRELEAKHEKMQALARMGRVVVHDLSNVLMVATLRAGELSREVDPDEAAKEIVNVLEYGGKLLHQLRAFCEQRETAAAPQVDAVSLLRRLEPTLRSLLGRTIDLALDCELPRAEIGTSPLELEQLVLNLCMNARDAIGSDGRIGISLSSSDQGVVLQVSDSGCGMDELTQSKLFEPFFSTKSGHSGVGLSAVYGIVERAHGQIGVESQPGRGTKFRITLPPSRPPEPLESPWSF